ncbi:MAG: GNAT family N-acetyltransferase [Clostridia bacterium]|nr:GNAT family N-acetyltransferase [Deltaproteobacteria bacterium]
MSHDLIIRRATVDDLLSVHRLVESGYRGESAKRGWTHEADLLHGQRTDIDSLYDVVRDSKNAILIAFADTALVGCVQVAAKSVTRGYLGMLTVDPSLQSKGLGRKLIASAEAYVRETWASRTMEMTVIEQRPELIAYYERRGYRNTGRREPFPLDDPRFGIPTRQDLVFVVLEKVLTATDTAVASSQVCTN